MSDAAMVVEVVTPERALLSSAAQAIVLRSSDGDLTILPGHTPLVTDVAAGIVRVDRDDGTSARLAVHGGYLHVDTRAEQAGAPEAGTSGGPSPAGPSGTGSGGTGSPDGSPAEGSAAGGAGTRVRLLAGVAELAEDIDATRAQRAHDEAQARVNELRAGGGRGAGEPSATASGADLELADAEAWLRRAEVRLSVARGGDGSA